MSEEEKPKMLKGSGADLSQSAPQAELNSTTPVQPTKKRNILRIFGLIVILIIVIGGITLGILALHKKPNTNSLPKNDIKIGSTIITPSDIKTLSTQLTKYSQQLHYSLGGPAIKVAENDLILNAALKDQARKHTITVTQADLNAGIPQPSLANASPSAYNQYLKSTGFAMVTKILNENKVYEAKLENVVIAKKNLFIVGITYDAPYFNNSSNPAALRSQATNTLKTKFLPLFQKGESESQIAAQTDLNYAGPNHPVNNPNLFFTGMPSFAYNYNNCTTAVPCFNDAEVGHFASIPGIVSTETKIAQLTKVGQYTDVFTSKAGFIGIIQLTGMTPGAYNSWDQLTQSYKKQYAPQLTVRTGETRTNSLVATARKAIHGVAGLGKTVGALILPAKAYADPSECTSGGDHFVTITYNAYFYNVKTGVTTPANGGWLQESRQDSVCSTSGGYYVDDSGQSGHRPNRMTTGASGSASAEDNCFTPVPYLLQREAPLPAGFSNTGGFSATVNSGGTSYTVNSTTDFGNQFGPAGENNPNSDISQLWAGGIINFNHGMTVNITYNVQPPPTHSGGVASPTVQCYVAQVDFSSLANNQEVQVTIQESTSSGGPNGPVLLTDTIHSGQSSPQREPGGSGFFTANEQYVFELTDIATDTVTHDSHGNAIHTWSYSNYTSAVSTPCYNADCSIDSVVGDLPGGNISAGGTVTVTASVYNDSPSGLALPGNDTGNGIGSAANVLSIQPGPGVNGGFSNMSPAYTGPIAYPYLGDTSVTQTFTTTVSADGNIEAYAGYSNSGTLQLPGAVCNYAVSIYQQPTATISVACNAAITGSASDPYAAGLSIPVMLYADGTDPSNELNGGNTILADGPGQTYSFNVPASLQDGQDHTIYVVAQDPFDVENGNPVGFAMTGCESFHVQPGANGGTLYNAEGVTPEAPTNFNGTATITVTYGASNSSTYNYPSFPGVPENAGEPTYTYTKNGAVVASGTVPSPTGNGRFNNTSYAVPSIGVTVTTTSAGNVYCLDVGANPVDGFVQNDGTLLSVSNSGPATQSSCDTVSNRPYFKVFGSSVSAGGNFSTAGDGSCTGGGTLAGWNNNTGTNPSSGDFGSGAQFGAAALSDIVGFASAQTAFGRSPTDLSFANSGAGVNITGSPPGDAYSPNLGGNLGGSRCLTDVTPPTASAVIPGPYTQTGTSISAGTNKSIFINGNVYISGNIIYASAGGGWTLAGATSVPSFVLHATGNIYISPSVTELDGMYVSGGKIYTCSNGTGTGPMAAASLYGSCNKQLTIYGSLVADQVDMLRTYGSLRDETPAAGTPASSITKNGTDFTACGPIAPGAYPCSADGNSVYNVQEFGATYSLAVPASSDYKLTLNYQNFDQGSWPPTSAVSPPYTYDIEVDVNGVQRGADLSLPATGPAYTVDLGALPANPSVTIKWKNNFYGTDIGFVPYNGNPNAYDPNFEINSLSLNSSSTPGGPAPTPLNCSNASLGNPHGTNGGANITPTCAAEVFQFSPEFYLSTPSIAPPNGGATQYDAITGLPPIL